MVDTVKNYGITGVGSTVELGKRGPKIDGSNSEHVAVTNKDGGASGIAVAEGTEASHAVALSQLGTATVNKLVYVTTTVSYNSGTVTVGNVSTGTRVHSVSVEKGAGNWTDADGDTEITVGDSGDAARLFSGFDPSVQVTEESGYEYASDDTITITVTQGRASAGTAKVTIWYSGTIIS